MAQVDLQTAIDRLYGAALEDFVAERTRLAKELRASGERPAAEELAKLPKPSAAAWALNHVAREEPDVVQGWLEAAEALRDASTQAAEIGGDALRAAMATHREATGRLLDVVGESARPNGRPLSGAMLDRVRTLLQSATADEGLAERVRAGRIVEEASQVDAVPEPPPRREKAKKKPSPRRERDRGADARAERRAELQRRVDAASEDVERLREEVAARENAAAAADERLEDARRMLQRSESEAAAARGALEDAEAAAAAAERELKQLRAAVRRAGG